MRPSFVPMVRAVGVAWVALLAFVAFVATASAADEKTDKKETTKKTWAVDASHGTYSDAIPIEVPAFRDITPELALGYDSSGGSGELGVGWTLEGVSVIERASPGKGAPRYHDGDIFLLDGKELVECAPDSVSPSCTTGGTHASKIESYERIALVGTGAGSRWTITSKDGIRREYAPVFTTGSGADVYRWGLERVVDTMGNEVTYAWGTNALGCCWEHLDSIAYGGTTITLYYEARPDLETQAIGSGSMRTQYGRIRTIDVAVDGDRVRTYALKYTQSGATGRSLLSSVQQYGRDATVDGDGIVTGGTRLPAITIEYQGEAPAFTLGDYDLAMSNSADTRFFAIDIDGDGRTDTLELYPFLGTMRRRAWMSDGSGFIEASDEPGMSGSTDARFLPMDVDGDGKTDVVELYPSLLSWRMRTWLSTGDGFEEASDAATESLFDEDSRFIAMDIDGDGKSDVLELRPSFATYRRVAWMSTGTGFVQGTDEPGIVYDEDSRFYAMDVDGDGRSDLVELFPSILSWGRRIWRSDGDGFSAGATESLAHGSDDEFIPMDINGDGKQDLLQVHPFASVSHLNAWISTGDGFSLASERAGAPFSADNWYLAMDVDGDGKSDLVELDPFGLSAYRRQIWLSRGTGFVEGAYDTDLGFSSETKLMAADVDGDGLSEMIELYPATIAKGRRVWSMSAGAYPDLLASMSNGIGGTTSVGYTASSAWENTNNPPLAQTVTEVTVDDGRGGAATTTYEYGGGLHDRLEKRFLGFRYQKQTRPCNDGESACPTVETWFRQDYGAASKPERIDHRAGDGQLLRSEVYEYTTNGATVPWTSLRTGEWEYTFVGSGMDCPGAECKRKYESRTFNEYGELAVAVDYGDYDLEGDETTLTTTFVPNVAAYIVKKPAEAKTFEGVGTQGALLEETLSYYDGATSWDRAPSAGLETTTARWLSSPSSFVETHEEHDQWGNVTAEIDAMGARTEHVYDETHHLLKIATINALGQTTTTRWDVVCGAPVETTDLDGQPTTMTYDALCRMTEKVAPGGRFERHAWVGLGDAEVQHELVETPAPHGIDGPHFSRTYFDGFRRTWRAVTRGPDAATGDIVVDTSYDARGQEASVTAAYFWVEGEPRPATYETTSSYDALDRLAVVTHPDGTFTTKTYGLWSVTETDELGHDKTDRFDAKGRRIAHDEIVGGEVQTSTYEYDERGHLARSTDPLGNTITYETDSLGRRTRIEDPDHGTITYEYDGAGRLTAQTDAKGQRTSLTYDALGRKTTKTTLEGTDAEVTVSWRHDEAREGYFNTGKLTTIVDEAGSETFDHDAAGNVVKTTRAIDGESYTFQHAFDDGGRKLWTTYPDGDTFGTASAPLVYDGAGRLASIPGWVDAAHYDAAGKLVRIENANGTVSTREHSPERGWLAAITTRSGDAPIQDLEYTRNAKGMITEVTSPVPGEGWCYEYDELDRLISATSAARPEDDQTFRYDAIGNVTYNSRLGEYRYDGAQPHAVTAAGPHTYAYDAAGLMTSGAGRTMTWDGDHRLASVVGGPADATQEADADDDDDDDEGGDGAGCGTAVDGRGPSPLAWLSFVLFVCACGLRRRASAATPRPAPLAAGLAALALAVACSGGPGVGAAGDAPEDDGPGADADPPGEQDGPTIAFTYDANGERIQQVEGATTRRHLGDGYEVEVGGSAIKYVSLAGSVIARKAGDAKTWVHVDHLGSIQAVTDERGQEVHRKAYRPYGEVLSTEGTLAFQPRGFTGQRHDASGLVYLHARYYDPALARFVSPDSIIDGEDTVGLNRYAYVAGDPVNHTDVTGKCKDSSCKNDPGAVTKKAQQEAALFGKKAAALIGKAGVAGAAAFVILASGVPADAGPIEQQINAIADTIESAAEFNPRYRSPTDPDVPVNPRALKPESSVRRPPATPTAPGGARAPAGLPRPGAVARIGRVAGPLGTLVTVSLAALDAQRGYSEARSSGAPIPQAVGAGVKEAAVGVLSPLGAAGDALTFSDSRPWAPPTHPSNYPYGGLGGLYE